MTYINGADHHPPPETKYIKVGLSESFKDKEIITGDAYTANTSFKEKIIGVDELITEHIAKGKAFTFSTFDKDYRKTENFKSLQLIGADLDDLAPNHDIYHHPFIAENAYALIETASSTLEKPRYRVLFLLDKEVADPTVAEAYSNSLHESIADLNPDQQCNGDIARFFYGSDNKSYTILGNVVDTQYLSTKPVTKTIEIIDTQNDGIKLVSDIAQYGFSEGQHNQQLRDATRALYRIMNGDNPTLKQDLLVSIMQGLDQRDPTPQGANFEPTVKSAIKYEQNRLGMGGSEQVSDVQLEVASFSAMLDKWGGYQTTYLVDELLPQDSLCMMSAPPETFKTWVMLDIALSVAMGDKGARVLNYFGVVPEAQPVIVIQQEDFMGLLVNRLQVITHGKELVSESLAAPVYLHEKSELSLENEESIYALERRIVETGARLVCVDPFYTLHSTEAYMSGAAQKMTMIKGVRDRTGCTFLFLHHMKKGSEMGTGNNRGNTWGSVLLDASFESTMQLYPGEVTNSVTLIRRGKFVPGAKKWGVEFGINTVTDEEMYNTFVSEASASGSREDTIIQILTGVAMSASDLSMETNIPRSSLDRVLTKLQKSGSIVRNGKKQWTARQEII